MREQRDAQTGTVESKKWYYLVLMRDLRERVDELEKVVYNSDVQEARTVVCSDSRIENIRTKAGEGAVGSSYNRAASSWEELKRENEQLEIIMLRTDQDKRENYLNGNCSVQLRSTFCRASTCPVS